MAKDIDHLKKELLLALESKDEVLTLDLLKQLGELPVTKDSVRVSGMGGELAKLTKCWSESVQEAAKNVIQTWKTTIKNSEKAAVPAKSPSLMKMPSQSSSSPSIPVKTDSFERGISIPDIVKPITGDKRRDVIICKLAGAMSQVLEEGSDFGLTQEALEQKAMDIEVELTRVFGKDPHGHKNKFLQLIRNLRDPQNHQLRLRVAVGHMGAAELVSAPPTELAPEQVKNELAAIEKYNAEAAAVRKNTEVTTRFGSCSKCKCPKTSYFMLQTRSADEPMTVFITCVNCGHAWRK